MPRYRVTCPQGRTRLYAVGQLIIASCKIRFELNYLLIIVAAAVVVVVTVEVVVVV
jgi:hypothetical protein